LLNIVSLMVSKPGELNSIWRLPRIWLVEGRNGWGLHLRLGLYRGPFRIRRIPLEQVISSKIEEPNQKSIKVATLR